MMRVEVALPLPLDRLFTYQVPEKLEGLAQTGRQVTVPFRNLVLKGVIVGIENGEDKREYHSPVSLKSIIAFSSGEDSVSPELLALTRWMSEKYACTWGESLSLVRQFKEKSYPNSSSSDVPSSSNIPLTDEQKAAVYSIQDAIQKQDIRPILLFGVTSSGKTEIYMKVIEKILSQNKQALYLVPEISLSNPLYEILKSRFGASVGLWHSKIGDRDKNMVSQGLKYGSVNVLLGARSALFAPFRSLGLIVMDEEHDLSYKNQEKPRYHARETALRLAQICGAHVVMGSATPSIESYYRAKSGEFHLLKLTRRIPGHSLPKIQVVDRKTGQKKLSPITPFLQQAISVSLARREQVIVALNRRGYSTFLLCADCGNIWKCESCEVTLVHHKADGDVLKCHYCCAEIPMPLSCGNCRSSFLVLGGFGTQRVVQELKSIFPYARVLRMDSDTAKKKSDHLETFHKFKGESADILVGTQMVTQGFDFPRVTLVGIVDADTALHHPDFRSSERTFQWISQASGRAGRSPLGGNVIVQTILPGHFALRAACDHDFESFYVKEIEFRKTAFYPPFTNLMLLTIQSSKRKDLVIPESERLADLLKGIPENSGIQVLGPGPSPKEHMLKHLRWQIMVKCPTDELTGKVKEFCKTFIPKPGVRISLDVDPYFFS